MSKRTVAAAKKHLGVSSNFGRYPKLDSISDHEGGGEYSSASLTEAKRRIEVMAIEFTGDT